MSCSSHWYPKASLICCQRTPAVSLPWCVFHRKRHFLEHQQLVKDQGVQGRKLEKHHCYYKRELACSTRSQELNIRPKVRSFREVGLGSKWRWSYWEQSKCCLQREWIPFLKFKQFIATSKRHKTNIIMSRMFPCSLPHHTPFPLQHPHILKIST